MYKTIGIVAHVDAGKTTFSEQLLYHTDTIRDRGRVDHKDAFLDSHAIEKSRGITVFADLASFSYNESNYTLVDTPGHVDFSAEMERAIRIMDAAVMIVSASDGVQGHTETVWKMLETYQVPTFFFINKIDREGVEIETVIHEMQESLSEHIFDLSNLKGGELSESFIEWIAERDEELLERYLADGYNEAVWMEKIKEMIYDHKVFPYGKGSALENIGVLDFLQQLDYLTFTDYSDEAPFAAKVYKIRHDEKGQRETFLKVTQGLLQTREEISYGNNTEKVTQIRKYKGTQFQTKDKVHAGEIVAVMGLAGAIAGSSVGSPADDITFNMIPALKSRVDFDDQSNVKEVLSCFKMLDAEDPSLHVVWDEAAQEIHIHVMGLIQLEVLQQLMKERFCINVSFGEPAILYKETIRSSVNGYGHFEPLRHYAEVHLKLEPAERGSGITFENRSHTDVLSAGHQNLIRDHVFERSHHGLLTGAALSDLKITLITGKGHQEHTSGGDFREATFRAIRQGLEKADNILLEPYYDFKIKVGTSHIGRVLSDLQQAHGSFEPPETKGETTVITGRVPVASFMNYSITFASFTKGKGSLNLQFGGYGECHNTEEVIAGIGYDKESDPDYTSTSIFCSKGKGYPVPWDKAEASMHLLK